MARMDYNITLNINYNTRFSTFPNKHYKYNNFYHSTYHFFFVITILTGWKPGMNLKKRESTNYSNISNHLDSSNSSFRQNDIFKIRFHSETNRECINCYCICYCLFNIYKKIIENFIK